MILECQNLFEILNKITYTQTIYKLCNNKIRLKKQKYKLHCYRIESRQNFWFIFVSATTLNKQKNASTTGVVR